MNLAHAEDSLYQANRNSSLHRVRGGLRLVHGTGAAESSIPQYTAGTLRSLGNVDESLINYELLESLVSHVVSTQQLDSDASAILIFLPGAPEISRLVRALQVLLSMAPEYLCVDFLIARKSTPKLCSFMCSQAHEAQFMYEAKFITHAILVILEATFLYSLSVRGRPG